MRFTEIFKISFDNKLNFASMIRHLILAYLVTINVEYLIIDYEMRSLSSTDYLLNMSFSRVLILTAMLFVLFSLLSTIVIFERAEPFLIAASVMLYALISLNTSFTPYFFAAMSLLVVASLIYCFHKYDSSEKVIVEEQKHNKVFLFIVAAVSLFICVFLAVWLVFRVITCSTPSFDFAIFSQMFYSMKKSFAPITTIERHYRLSHFKVHVSPIYYLFLPFYCIFPYPATLQVLTAVVMASSVIPLWLIAAKRGLSPKHRMMICAAFMLYPAFCAGASFDLHENVFLTPCILWLFYALEKRSVTLSLIFTALTLGIKEDAAVYAAVIGLYYLINYLLHKNKKERIKQLIISSLMIVLSVSYFIIVTNYLAKFGDGVMTWRYNNFIYDGSSSLFAVIKAVIMSPAKMLYECVDAEKIGFILLSLVPLLGLPLLTRKFERYILLIPYLLINLMTDYGYQYNIFFQYCFGSAAFLIYLTVINFADLRRTKKKTLVALCSLCLCALCFFAIVFPEASFFPKTYYADRDRYDTIEQTMSTIPEEASVAATAFFATGLSQRDVIYDVFYCTDQMLLECDFVVLGTEGYDREAKLLETNGYTVFAQRDNTYIIYESPEHPNKN